MTDDRVGAGAAVLMPVYNEERTVSAVVDSVRSRFSGEMLVVDDGSTDGTPDILARRDDLRVVRFEENRGYGAALAAGFDVAAEKGADVVITMDCDGQHEPRHIAEFLGELRSSGADIVSGSRYLPESGSLGEAPSQRKEVNAAVTAEINAVTGWGLTDAFCGFKAYRLQALRGMTFTEPGYGMPMEMWARAYSAGLRVVEMPVERIYFDHDRSFGQDLDDPAKRLRYYLSVWRKALVEEGIA